MNGKIIKKSSVRWYLIIDVFTAVTTHHRKAATAVVFRGFKEF